MDFRDRIASQVGDTRGLEALYRENPTAFIANFPQVFKENPDSVMLQVWNERLRYEPGYVDMAKGQEGAMGEVVPGHRSLKWNRVAFVIILALLAGVVFKVLSVFPENLIPRYGAFVVFPWMALYFLVYNRVENKVRWVVGGSFLFGLAFVSLLPWEESQTVNLSFIHLSLVLWVLTGVAFAGAKWRSTEKRLEYLRFNAELAIYGLVLMAGGMVVAMVSIQLFMGNFSIIRFITENVVIFGAAGIPIVATYLADSRKHFLEQLLPVLSKIFSPMFLVLLAVYLVNVLFMGISPFQSREVLLVLNIVLLFVMAFLLFLLQGRGKNQGVTFTDYITFASCGLGVVTNAVAVTGIILRFAEYGLTPNRLAVLGANILIFVNLVGVLWKFGRFLWKSGELAKVEQWIAEYFTVYFIWTLVVTVGFPLIFGFQ